MVHKPKPKKHHADYGTVPPGGGTKLGLKVLLRI